MCQLSSNSENPTSCNKYKNYFIFLTLLQDINTYPRIFSGTSLSVVRWHMDKDNSLFTTAQDGTANQQQTR